MISVKYQFLQSKHIPPDLVESDTLSVFRVKFLFSIIN